MSTDDTASLAVANGTLTVTRVGLNREGRTKYEWQIHIDGRLAESGSDLATGVGMDAGPVAMLVSLCSFLGACAESYAYWMRTGTRGENWSLFSKAVREWAYENADELSLAGPRIDDDES